MNGQYRLDLTCGTG